MFQDTWYSLMRRIPVLGRKKYFLAASTYLTPKKIYNILKCEYEAEKKVLNPSAYPYIAIFDVANICNLKCPYCPTGAGQASGHKLGYMDIEIVERVLDEIGDYIVMAYLYHWGEPLLNPNIGKIVELCHKRNIFTSLSSNLSLDCTPTLMELCDNGLDHLDPSIDGATQETYSKYRRNGDLAKVLENLKFIIDYRRQKNRLNPVIDWQFLTFNHNRHEIEAARALAAQLGIDRFFTRHGYSPEDTPEGLTGDNSRDAQRCKLLYRSIVINSDYSISPCCYIFNSKNVFGNAKTASIMDIRQNKRYVMARKLFRLDLKSTIPQNLEHPCLLCNRTAAIQPELYARMQNRLVKAEPATADDFHYNI